MKYISVDYIVDICQVNITMLKAYRQSVAVSALRRVMEAVKEDCVEAEPVKHGRWIRAEAKGYPVKRSSIWYCSECGEKIKYNDTLGRYQKTKKTVSQVNPRCRKCGARMDGKERENDDKM